MKYTVYCIKGEDKNGPINIERRFNEFYEMRAALVKRWPGCFIPSVPSKTLMKNDDEQVRKRLRYLNDFIRKIIQLPHLYNSQEFQLLIRSKDADISKVYQQWATPTPEEVIIKYRECFS